MLNTSSGGHGRGEGEKWEKIWGTHLRFPHLFIAERTPSEDERLPCREGRHEEDHIAVLDTSA